MQPDPVMIPVILIAAFLVVVTLAVLQKSGLPGLNHLGQGLLGLGAALGLVVAAAAYFADRQDKPRVDLATNAVVVGLPPLEGRERRALIQFVTTIRNNARRPMEVACASIDALGIPASGEVRRSAISLNDLDAEPLLGETATGEIWRMCMEAKAAMHPKGFEVPKSGFRYKTFFLEPSEARSRHFELIVPCRYGAVRFTFSIDKPDDPQHVYEIKRIVPLTEVCESKRPFTVLE